MFGEVCSILRALPDRQGFGGLLWKLRGIDEHEFEKKLQVANVAGQSGAEDPGPTPTLPSFSPTEVHQHCIHHSKTQETEMVHGHLLI